MTDSSFEHMHAVTRRLRHGDLFGRYTIAMRLSFPTHKAFSSVSALKVQIIAFENSV